MKQDQIPPPDALPTSQSDGGVQLRDPARHERGLGGWRVTAKPEGKPVLCFSMLCYVMQTESKRVDKEVKN